MFLLSPRVKEIKDRRIAEPLTRKRTKNWNFDFFANILINPFAPREKD